MQINFSKPFLTTTISKLSNHIFKVNHACGVAWLSMLIIVINPDHSDVSTHDACYVAIHHDVTNLVSFQNKLIKFVTRIVGRQQTRSHGANVSAQKRHHSRRQWHRVQSDKSGYGRG